MIKGAIPAAVGFFALCLSLSAQQPLGPEQRLYSASLLDYPTVESPWASLENRDRFFFSTAFGSMRPSENYLPVLDPSEPLSYAAPATSDSKNSLDRVVDLRAPNRFSYGGEIGFLYGKSTGKQGYGREDFQTYILGTVGNDKFQITAGFLHQETTVNVPRRRR
jgi:hypothetical protein